MKLAARIGLRGLLVVGVGLLWAASAHAADACVDCHKSLREERFHKPAASIVDDYHIVRGLKCVSCHGGDPEAVDAKEASHSPKKRFLGKPKRRDIPEFCGRCHSDAVYMKKFNPSIRTDQVKEYFTSTHGKKLREGDEKVAVCINCHDVHAIRAIKDRAAWTYPARVAETCGRCHADPKHMAGYKIPTNQLERYKASYHYEALTKKGDLSAPTCSSCHGHHGATPPGAESVASVCSNCHSATAELFAKSAHKEAFEDLQQPACVTCHGNHAVKRPSDDLLAGGKGTPCQECHEPDSKETKKGIEVRNLLAELAQAIQEADTILTRAELAGMEVGPPRFDLIEARDALTKARAETHVLDLKLVKTITEPGLATARKTTQHGHELMRELQFRRKGLAASLVVIGLVLVGLLVKIREVDRRDRSRRQ